MSYNKTSQYRLYSPRRGVIGPPGLDADKIVKAELYSGKNIVIEWEHAGRQKIDCFDAQLQEFIEHKLPKWETLVSNSWFKLLGSASFLRSNSPKFILLTGLPGSGKTALAQKLSVMMGWLHFDFADFAHQIIGASPLMTNDYRKVGTLAEKKINDAIKDGVSVIYDTTAPSVEIRQHHLDAVEFTDAKYIVYVPTPLDLCLKRVSLRHPASSIDTRNGICRSDINHIRTFRDYANDYIIPNDCILASNELDLNTVLAQLHQ